VTSWQQPGDGKDDHGLAPHLLIEELAEDDYFAVFVAQRLVESDDSSVR